MQLFSQSIKSLAIAMSVLIAMPVFAESAPVYDADNMPQQVDNGDQAQTSAVPGEQPVQDVAPPAPEQQDTFVPAPSPSTGSISTSSMNTDQRLRRIEQQIANIQNTDTTQRIDSLQDQVQTLRGQVDQLTRTLQQVQGQQKSQYADLDKRIAQQAADKPAAKSTDDTTDDAATTPAKPARKAAKAAKAADAAAATTATAAAATTTAASAATPAPASKTKSTEQPNVAEEQQIYQTAYNLIKAKKYDEAVTALQSMLQKYPSGQFASNAHYWLGELYGLMGKNDQALTEFDNVVQSYPDSPRVSDAQLKLGLIYAAQSKWTDAKSAFRKVINRYPGTAPARLASEQLKQIKQAGH